jgi:hypothetical protein
LAAGAGQSQQTSVAVNSGSAIQYNNNKFLSTFLSNAGTLSGTSGGLLGVGSGTFSASSGFQELSNGTLDEIINGQSSFGLINDLIAPASLNGTLEITLANGFTPAFGQSFVILEAEPNDLSGKFATIENPTYPGGQWQETYNDAAGTVTLTAGVAAVPEPAIALLGGVVMMIELTRRPRRRR